MPQLTSAASSSTTGAAVLGAAGFPEAASVLAPLAAACLARSCCTLHSQQDMNAEDDAETDGGPGLWQNTNRCSMLGSLACTSCSQGVRLHGRLSISQQGTGAGELHAAENICGLRRQHAAQLPDTGHKTPLRRPACTLLALCPAPLTCSHTATRSAVWVKQQPDHVARAHPRQPAALDTQDPNFSYDINKS